MSEHTFSGAAEELELRVEQLEDAVFGDEPDDPGPAPTPGDPTTLEPDLPGPGGGFGDPFFDAHAPTAFARWSGRTQRSIDRWSMGNPRRIRRGDVTTWEELEPNTLVRYDHALGAAAYPALASNLSELYLPIGLQEPAGNRYLISWCSWWSREWLEYANRDDDPVGFEGRPWRNTKLHHLLADDDVEPTGDGALKVNFHFTRATARQTPDHLGEYFGETRPGYLGPDATDAAPIQPSRLGELAVLVERWHQITIDLQEGDAPGERGFVSIWLEAQGDPPVKAIDGLGFRPPWNEASGTGIRSLHVFTAPKPSQPPPASMPTYGIKNLIVLQNPDPGLFPGGE